jgi:hypothetical protein
MVNPKEGHNTIASLLGATTLIPHNPLFQPPALLALAIIGLIFLCLPLMLHTHLHPSLIPCLILEVSLWMKKFLLSRCSLWKLHQSLASSPVPRPNLWSKATAWLRKKFPPVG